MNIYDIAREAGVSIATVSRVLNHKDTVRADTRAKVEKVLKRCNYAPSAIAQGMVSKSLHTVAVLTVDIRDSHYARTAYTIEREFGRRGYEVILCNTGGDRAETLRTLQAVAQKQVDGLILVGSIFNTICQGAEMENLLRKMPVVLANGTLALPDAYSVMVDDCRGVEMAVEHLVKTGRRNLYYIKDKATDSAAAKAKGEKLSMLTAYDYSTAKLEDESGINGILVGDSLGNVMLGYEDTVSVTMEDMIHHGAAVARGAKNALVVVDMPFMSYEVTVEEAVRNAGRLMKEGRAGAVKLEGGVRVAEQIRAIVKAGIPVMGHIGLTPQSINVFGGFKVQGKSEEAARALLADAKAVEEAGAFAVVIEAVPAALAQMITDTVSIPTIGIGAGAGCDGQILVYQDMLGMFSDFTPKFVKRYANVGEVMREAFANYAAEAASGAFPTDTYKIKDDVLEKLY